MGPLGIYESMVCPEERDMSSVHNLELYRTLERSNVTIDSDHPIPTKIYLTILTKIIYLDRCSSNVLFGNA